MSKFYGSKSLTRIAVVLGSNLILISACSNNKSTDVLSARKISDPAQSDTQNFQPKTQVLTPHDEVNNKVLSQISSVSNCKGKLLAPARYWRLTDSQMANTLKDAFSAPNAPELAGFRVDRFKERFGNDTSRLLMTPDLVFSSTSSAQTVSNWLAQNIADVKSCVASNSSACIATLRDKYGPLLWRQPLATDDVQALEKLIADAGSENATQEDKVTVLLEALILSPHFLYRSEVGSSATVDGRKVRKLGGYEVASFLSYTLWETAPDKVLYDLAAQDKLSSEAAVKEQVSRMLADPRGKKGMQQLFDQWLGLKEVLTKAKDASYLADFTSDIRNDMRAESVKYLDDMIWKRNATLSEIFSSNQGFLNSRLANYYGFPSGDGNDFSSVTFDSSKRAGILTTGAFLSAFSNDKGTGLVHRADFTLKHLLCSPLPPPPPGIVNAAANAPEGMLTTRQKFEKLHSSQSSCAACHKSLDPLGGAFESWDSIGRYRATEFNLPIDSSGNLFLEGKSEMTYQTGTEFLQKLSASDRLAQCYSIKAYQAVAGLLPTEDLSCEVAQVHAKNKELSFKSATVFEALSSSNLFLYRDERSGK